MLAPKEISRPLAIIKGVSPSAKIPVITMFFNIVLILSYTKKFLCIKPKNITSTIRAMNRISVSVSLKLNLRFSANFFHAFKNLSFLEIYIKS